MSLPSTAVTSPRPAPAGASFMLPERKPVEVEGHVGEPERRADAGDDRLRAPRRPPAPARPPRPRRGRRRRGGARGTGGSRARAATRSAAATAASFSTVMGSPYGMRDARHACCGASQVARPRSRARRRTSSLPMPASSSGCRTPPSAGGAHAGPVVAEVVEVGAVDQRGAAVLGGDAPHLGDQLALAEVAALARVAGERRLVELVRLHDHVAHAEVARRGRGRRRSSSGRYVAETAVKATTSPAPRARAAAASTRLESTPPEKATQAEPSCASSASRRCRAESPRVDPLVGQCVGAAPQSAAHVERLRRQSIVVDQSRDGRVLAAHRARGHARHLDLVEGHGGAVELHQPVVQRAPGAGEHLDDLERLEGADGPGDRDRARRPRSS